MKRNKLKQVQDDIFPKPIVAVSYSDIFGKTDANISTIIKDLPMIVVLAEVLRSHLTVHFSMYAREPHKKY